MDLSLKNLEFSYSSNGKGFSLKKISLNIPSGSFSALIGPNGSGKTTLLRLLCHSLKPSGGDICLGGKPIHDFSPKERAKIMAVISSEQYFEFPFLVRDVVAMGRYPHLGRLEKVSNKGWDLIEEAMEKTKIKAFENRPISNLSSGERQRVLIARALAQKPSILMLDEPNAHLDINHLIEIFKLLKTLNQEENLTSVVVLHDLSAAAAFCQTVILMHQGQLIQSGKPAEVITEENVRQTYGAEVKIYPSPHGNYPQITFPI